ncbi:MAG: response regulator [Clostridia bacterium]
MKILYVDDERSAHINFRYSIKDRTDISSVKYCFDFKSAVEYARGNKVDCAFLDISLSGENGIELAKELCSIQPEIELAFVTGYDEFAREAYKVGGRAYLSKPYSEEEMNRLLTLMEKLVHPPKSMVEKPFTDSFHLFAKTFGAFDFMVDGVPIHFKNAKAKELLAFLIHQMGGTSSNTQIFYALWESQEYTRNTSSYVRRTVRALKDELDEIGIGDLLTSKRGSISIDIKRISCDSYEVFRGNANAVNAYNGEYMSQYSWGESTIPIFDRVINDMEYSRK